MNYRIGCVCGWGYLSVVVLWGGNSRAVAHEKGTGRHTQPLHFVPAAALGESWQIREFLWLPLLLPFDGQINASRRCLCAAFGPPTSPQTSSNVSTVTFSGPHGRSCCVWAFSPLHTGLLLTSLSLLTTNSTSSVSAHSLPRLGPPRP